MRKIVCLIESYLPIILMHFNKRPDQSRQHEYIIHDFRAQIEGTGGSRSEILRE